MRIGVDWGGTKLEVIVLDEAGEERFRKRVPTPKDDYQCCLNAVSALVTDAENSVNQRCSVGVGIPGSLSPHDGRVRNANSTWMNGQSLKEDLQTVIGREVRIENDANCFAVSEAVDGAGQAGRVVAGIIIGTGCGSGLSIDRQVLHGRNGIGGEFGHTPLGWLTREEYPGEKCWCGRTGCLETWISGTGFQRAYQRRSGEDILRSAQDIIALETDLTRSVLTEYCNRLARGLAVLVNIVDPDIIVLGGGMSNVPELYDGVRKDISQYVFSDIFDTPIVQAQHGDSSGVRGAAWLW